DGADFAKSPGRNPDGACRLASPAGGPHRPRPAPRPRGRHSPARCRPARCHSRCSLGGEMKVTDLAIEGVKLIVPQRFADTRGYFVETWNRKAFAAEAGLDLDFVQDNASLSRVAGTVRGLHYQTPPMAQAKLVRCARGALVDVVVDIR